MFKKHTIALAISASFLLSGCLEVEDNNNDELVSAIEEQNKATQEAETATLTGTVKNYVTDSLATNAQIQIKIGNTWSEAVSLSDGMFELKNIPKHSDYVLLVTSTNDSFQQRAFYGNSGAGVSQLGSLSVTTTETIQFTALLDGENTPIKDLQFTYTTSLGLTDSSWQSRNEHFFSATYNEQTNLYSIEKPVGLGNAIALHIDMDVDNDAINDYELVQNYYNQSSVSFSTLNDDATILFKDTDATKEYQLRVKVIDETGQVFSNIELVASSNDFESNPLTFDATENEYVYDFKGSSSLTVRMSAFTDVNGQNYLSDSFSVREENGELVVGNIYNQGNFQVEDGVVSVIFKANKGTQTTQVDLLSQTVNALNNGYYLFFSKPIELTQDSFSLVRSNSLTVIRGNESTTDSVPAGSTFFIRKDVDITTTSSLSLNDTFVEVLPEQALSVGRYKYRLNSVIDKETALTANYSFENEFTVADKAAFSIEDVKFDNNNGLKAGQLIHATNSAGESAASSSRGNNVRLYLPTSIASLAELDITLTGYTNNGTMNPVYEELTIVSGEYIYNDSLRNLVSIALNETAYGDSGNAIKYTSLPDGLMYMHGLPWDVTYLDDNASGNVNTITFDYEYRVKGSKEVVTGSATVPVL